MAKHTGAKPNAVGPGVADVEALAAAATPTEGLHSIAVLQGLAARLGLPVVIFPWGAGFRIVNHAAQREVWLSATGQMVDVPFDPKGAPQADPTSRPSG